MKTNRPSQPCIDVQNIGAVLSLRADDPVRIHANECPRCKSLLASYQAFVDAEPTEGSDLERVRGMLDARIRADAARWKPSKAPVRFAAPHLSRTDAEVLSAAAAMKVRQPTGPATPCDGVQVLRFPSSKRAAWVHPSRRYRCP